tara:strand:- start:7502 stop:7750 length:249 start_codon:yes stop_codon:yes gene_type:complete
MLYKHFLIFIKLINEKLTYLFYYQGLFKSLVIVCVGDSVKKRSVFKMELRCKRCNSKNIVSTKTERVCRRCGHRKKIKEDKK